MNFNFDYWAELYKSDPDAYNRERLAFLEEYARKLHPDDPDKVDRAMAMINGYDMRLDRIKNPISRQKALENMFSEQMNRFLNALRGIA